jgi:1-acyl-sn-glycerol-3-phosphate acyltransferase
MYPSNSTAQKGEKNASSIPAKRKMQKKPSLKKLFFKTLIKCNPLDPFCQISRDLMKLLGVLDGYDERYYWAMRNQFRKIFQKYWGYDLKGFTNFPDSGGALVISNHQSELDPFLVGSSVHRKIQWLSKQENFKIPLFRSFITPFGTLPLRRGEKDVEALNRVRNVLEMGGCVGMFPEGTRSPDGVLGSFHSGAGRLCIETGVPYIPCAIFGAYKVFPKHAGVGAIKWKGGFKISVSIGRPVYIDPSMELTYENVQKVRDAMRQDVLTLQSGEMNQSRIIGEKTEIFLSENEKIKSKQHSQSEDFVKDESFQISEYQEKDSVKLGTPEV